MGFKLLILKYTDFRIDRKETNIPSSNEKNGRSYRPLAHDKKT